MSNFEWTEAQVNKFIKRLKHKKGWLNTRDVRSGNTAKASDDRKLMKLIVDRGIVFDNGIATDSEQYKVCFNLEDKDGLLEDLENSSKEMLFDPSLMSDSRMNDLPKKKILEYAATLRIRIYWEEIKNEWKRFIRHCADIRIERKLN
jgi:hypothetical protein